MKQLMFSIVMPTYNRAYCIEKAIDSLLCQKPYDYELIIVDDGSTDNTEKLIVGHYAKEIEQSRVVYIKSDHKGAAFARNRGLAEAKGEWIGYLDSDNEMVENYLELYRAAIKKHPLCKIFYAKMLRVNKNQIVGKKWSFSDLLAKPYIDMGTLVHNRQLVKKFGNFDENLKRLIDYELILRYTRRSTPFFIDEVVLKYDDSLDKSRITTTIKRDACLSYIMNKHGIKRCNTESKQTWGEKMGKFLLKIGRITHLLSKKKYDDKRKITLIEHSPLFDKKWYLSKYPDVKSKKISAAKHYYKYGWKEGRNPSPYFDGNYYLKQYNDVARSGENPLAHYLINGIKEKRKYRPCVKGAKILKIDDKKTICDKICHILRYPIEIRNEYDKLVREIRTMQK